MTPRPESSTNGDSNKEVYMLPMNGYRLSHPPPGEEIVVSGISGKFPSTNSVHELGKHLLNKVELVKDDPMGWVYVHPDIPSRIGRLNNPNHFDASFFGIHFNQAQSMDPAVRMLLEKTYEAIIDAGANPASLKGTKTAVFVGTCYSESERTWIYENAPINGFGASGCSRSMLANQVSYWLDIKGPSFTVDSACSSSLYTLELAYKAIRDGECDAAIIGAVNLSLHPCVSLQFTRMGVMSPEGRSHSFDNRANGYARAEAVVAVYIQKAKDARRIYAQAVHIKTNSDGHKEHGITYPSGDTQMKLFRELYGECGVNPNDVEFIDAHATGTRAGDPEELRALDGVFCKGRRGPLKVGSIKTNIGHTEPASGLCSLAKMCVAYNTGYIPPNLNYETPREGVEALAVGRIEVVTKVTPWNRGLSGINSFGFGGSNAHVLLRNLAKSKVNNGSPKDSITRLVCVSGRTESAVKRILDDLVSRPYVDAEQIGLIHAIYEQEIQRHGFRGYSLIRPHNSYKEATREIIKYFPSAKKPIGFVFSGMGSQWPGLGRDLMQNSTFVKIVERCDKVLKPKGVDILRILCDKDGKSFNNVVNSFIGITVVHIGLCDVLKSIGVEPDFFMGHGIGELACAYADGCLSAEEVILAAYYSGLAAIESLSVKGSMAEVGLGYDTLKNYCPEDVDIACHNSFESSVISGPAESVKLFIARLQGRHIHYKELPSSNIAFHSRYMDKAGIILSNCLKKLLPSQKLRSSRWFSTSDLLENCTEKMYNPAEYHTNSLLRPVLFEETYQLIPNNAIVIEVGSNGWLKTIRRRLTHINLIKRDVPSQFEFMLKAFGTLYHNGVNLKLAKLYPEIMFPVSAGTPMLANLVEWDHREDWFVSTFNLQDEIRTGERLVTMNIEDKDSEYMAGHVVDGRNLYPATGYLVLVWETLALMQGQFFTQVSVTFEDVKFMRATNIPKVGNLEFIVMIQKGTGNFEITESGASIVSGRIYVTKNLSKTNEPYPEPKEPTGIFSRKMIAKDIYKELRLRGYNYTGEFKGITEANVMGTKGELMWLNNWVTFLDTMMQMSLFSVDTRGLFVPTSLRKLTIDTTKHYMEIKSLPQDQQLCLPVTVYREIELIRSGGAEFRGLSISPITKRNLSADPVLEKNLFIPFFPNYKMETKDVVRNSVQLILETVQGIAVKAVELIDSETSPNTEPLTPLILEALEDLPLIQANVLIMSEEKLNVDSSIPVQPVNFSIDMSALLLVGSNLLKRHDIVQQSMIALNKKGYILSRESLNSDLKYIPETLELIASCKTNIEQLVLLKRPVKDLPDDFMVIKQSDNKFSWIDELKIMMQKSQKIVLVSEGEKLNGIIGLVNCLRKEPGGNRISCLAIMDKDAPKFNKDLPFYKDQLTKQLGINVYKNGQWGSYRHIWLDPLQTVKADHAYLNVLTNGDLSSFRWFQGGLRMDVEPIVHVYYAPIVFRDTLIASGRIAQESYAKGRLNNDCLIGTEFSGRTLSGERVMGLCASRGLANMVAADPKFIWSVPDNWTLDEAATVPNVYSTVVYAFFIRTTLKPGSRVLIHAGAGGVGQSAIYVCLYYGCEVFTTVGSQAKRDFIRKTFPEIPESHIGNSRDTSFEDMVMKETNGEGVDYVLNSLAEEKLMASVRCLAPRGKFLEIGKFDILNNNELGMHLFNNEQSFQGIMMDFVLNGDTNDCEEIHRLITEHINNGCIKPLCSTTFGTDEVEKAFRFMSAGKHIGKVVIKIRDEEEVCPTKVEPLCLDAIPRYHCYPEYSYIVVGGLGGFGLELTDWLVLRGARNIILNSRRGISNGYQTLRIKTWTDYGVQVVVSQDDVTTQAGCIKMLQNAETLGPVRAIFNLAVILKDAIFENQTPEMFQTSFAPKAFATKLLDEESRKRCPQLKNFVVFSSVSCGRGNAGQTNYGMANSIMERICEERQKAGYPALAIQWGAVGEVGLVADMQQEHMELEIGGTLQQRITSCLSVMDNFLSQTAPIVSSMVVAEKRVGAQGGCDVLGTVGGIMGLKDLKTISQNVTLTELGMDSIMAVEIRQVLEREFEIITTPQSIRTMTFAKLLQLVDKVDTGDQHVSAPTSEIKESNTGLDFFLKNLGEEVEKTETCVRMPTLCSEDINKNNNNGPQMFMIPGIEGMAVVFESLTKKLNCEATVLQMGYEYSGQDALSFAKRLIEPIKSTLCCQSEFVLLGYSYGSLVALEAATLLESQGHKGKVILIDGSPEYLQQFIKVNLRSKDSKEFENAVMSLIHDTILPNNKTNILQALQGVSTWAEKMDILVKLALSDVKYSESFLRKLVNSIYERTQAIAKNNLSGDRMKLKSTGYLLRIKDVQTGIVTAEDYSMKNFFENPVRVFMLDGNHSSIIANDDCANIINKIFSD